MNYGLKYNLLGLPAALVAVACGPGRPGLLRCFKGGLDCLASARARVQEAVGLGFWWRLRSDKEIFRAPAKS